MQWEIGNKRGARGKIGNRRRRQAISNEQRAVGNGQCAMDNSWVHTCIIYIYTSVYIYTYICIYVLLIFFGHPEKEIHLSVVLFLYICIYNIHV